MPQNNDHSRAEEEHWAEEFFLNNPPEALLDLPDKKRKKILQTIHLRHLELKMQNEELRRMDREVEALRVKYMDLFDYAPVSYLILDEEGIIRDFNHAALSMLSLKGSQLAGKKFAGFVNDEYKEMFQTAFDVGFSSPDKQKSEVELLTPGESPLFAEVISSAVVDPETGDKQCLMALFDISESRRIVSELQEIRDRLEINVQERTKKLENANQTLRREIKQRKEAERRFIIEKDIAESILNNLPGIFFLSDEKGNFKRWNDNFEYVSGYGHEEIPEMNLLSFFDENNRRIIQDHVRTVYARGSAETEASILSKNNVLVPYYFTGIFIMHENEPCVLEMGLKATELKRAEKRLKDSLYEKEVLLQEIHHRVKNNLTIISSLLSMQSGKVRDKHSKTLFKESEHRIRSMAMIHELLYQTESFAEIDFGTYLKKLIGYLSENYRSSANNIETRVEVERIHLSMNTAVPCALMINEILTNAYVHAFKGRTQGTIIVRLSYHKKDFCKLVISDNGIGLPEHLDLKKAPSLGLSLIFGLCKQINGDITVDRKAGTTYTIIFQNREDASRLPVTK